MLLGVVGNYEELDLVQFDLFVDMFGIMNSVMFFSQEEFCYVEYVFGVLDVDVCVVVEQEVCIDLVVVVVVVLW